MPAKGKKNTIFLSNSSEESFIKKDKVLDVNWHEQKTQEIEKTIDSQKDKIDIAQKKKGKLDNQIKVMCNNSRIIHAKVL